MAVSEYAAENQGDLDLNLDKLIRRIERSQGRFVAVSVISDYDHLRGSIYDKLKKELESKKLEFRELLLSSETPSLFKAIEEEVKKGFPSVLCIRGFDRIAEEKIETFYNDLNLSRDNVKKSFQFPLIFWFSEQNFVQINNVAPDFSNYLSVSIHFKLSFDELNELIQKESDNLFNKTLSQDSGNQLINNGKTEQKNTLIAFEAEVAYRELEKQGALTDFLNAALDFILGQKDYLKGDLDKAISRYHSSLKFWQEKNNHERQGIIFFCISLCYKRKAEKKRVKSQEYWEEEKEYIDKCLEKFKSIQRDDLVANFINALVDVRFRLAVLPFSELQLQRKTPDEQQESLKEQLELLDRVKEVASKAKSLHEGESENANINQLVENYGFLATIALEKADNLERQYILNKTDNFKKEIEELAKEAEEWARDAFNKKFLREARRSYEAWYCLLFARSYIKLKKSSKAGRWLKRAKKTSNPDRRLLLHIKILKELQKFYFNQGEYLKAFQEQQENRKIEAQYGLRAFVGAMSLEPDKDQKISNTILVSGRDKDIEAIKQRVISDDGKLTVIHGPSGVGKSSLIKAGLIPTFQEKNFLIKTQRVLSLFLNKYDEKWEKRLGDSLKKELESKEIKVPETLDSRASILMELGKSKDRNIRVVLIFEQFEEFFFYFKESTKRKEFFVFLSDCLKHPYIYVLLSLREDYLHHLLEGESLVGERLGDGIHGILSTRNRHILTNFTKEEAQSIIQKLTDKIDDNFIENLINDLAPDDNEKIRPIELQIIGSQLIDFGIENQNDFNGFEKQQLAKQQLAEQQLAEQQLAASNPKSQTNVNKSQERRPSQLLIHSYIQQIIESCGDEKNKNLANAILYLLTDNTLFRPIKSEEDLKTSLQNLLDDDNGDKKQERLDVVLGIFVLSGLVKLFDKPTKNYQLVHDYLAVLIRSRSETDPTTQWLREKLNTLEVVNKRLETEIDARNKAQGDLSKVEVQLEKRQKYLYLLGVATPVLFLIAIVIFSLLIYAKQKLDAANQQRDDANLEVELIKLDLRLDSFDADSQIPISDLFNTSFDYLKRIRGHQRLETKLIKSLNLIVSIFEKGENLEEGDKKIFYVGNNNILLNSNGQSLVMFNDKKVSVFNAKNGKLLNTTKNIDGYSPLGIKSDSTGREDIISWKKVNDKKEVEIRVSPLLQSNAPSKDNMEKPITVPYPEDQKPEDQKKWIPSAIKFSRDKKTLVVAFTNWLGDGNTKILIGRIDENVFKPDKKQLSPDIAINLADITLSNDDRFLLIAYRDGNLKKLDLSTGKITPNSVDSEKTKTQAQPTNEISTLRFCANSEILASVNREGVQFSTPNKSNIPNKSDRVLIKSIACSRDAGVVATQYNDGTVMVSKVDSIHKEKVSSNNSNLGKMQKYMLDKENMLDKEQNKPNLINAYEFSGSQDSKKYMGAFVTTNNSAFKSCVSLVDSTGDLVDMKKDCESQKQERRITALAFSQDARYLALGSEKFSGNNDDDKLVEIWDLDDLKKTPKKLDIGKQNTIMGVNFSNDNKFLAIQTRDAKVLRWEWNNSKNLQPEPIENGSKDSDMKFGSVSFNPDNTKLAVALNGYKDSKIAMYDTNKKSKKIADIITGQDGIVNKMIFDPTGKYLAVVLRVEKKSNQESLFKIRLWDVKSDEKKAQLLVEYPPLPISSTLQVRNLPVINFSLDGKQLSVIDDEMNAHEYPLPNLELLQKRACYDLKIIIEGKKALEQKITDEEEKNKAEICSKD
jgi:WD40 repeat protein